MSATSRDSSTATVTSPLAQTVSRRAFYGLFECKERWSFSWRGRLIVAFALLLVGALLLKGVYPFLAITHRVDADVLVVEGWVHKYVIQAAAGEFSRGSYRHVFSTGGPVTGSGGYVNDYQTSASVGASLLKNAGLPPTVVQMVPSRVMHRDRTYGSAVALREWFRAHNMAVQSVNVMTENAHARRTRLLFEKALGKNVTVGIIAVPNPDYDKGRWWWYSEGVKDVGSEALAYIYARLFFHRWELRGGERVAEGSQTDSKQ
jgi:uncharacterized SAM-binding protein YcdF (DUF218 family)